ncbi:molybdopterin-dependent oxidoreductase [Bradyrhizobium hipponense]|uniref:Molybdopterin-dependent oxidoreductase n=1 Tax=Bradyrhizobium hipponense TaxID=2605638 RepID=A0A5S4YS76_9BRAD|nr:molybdopterin-dependent oxidoreductase [Bradyrhizobium hipponense]TYO66307.1 molybdopterin-dependent oxidoreductase [Bradyrhizobium hipponense]
MPLHRNDRHVRALTRRAVLKTFGVAGMALAGSPAWADQSVRLLFASGPQQRPITPDFPQKGPMILQRTRPPLLETPMEVFDRSVFTPNDQFYVRWHWAVIPTSVDVDAFRLAVRGHVNQVLSLSIGDLLKMPRVELAAVNQCSGNSRGFFSPRVPGAQWAHGAMGNARWTGVRLKDVLDRAGIKSGAIQVRFSGLDEPVVPEAPDFRKSLDLDHARDGEVMIAFAMNGEQMPLLNGFPLRLIVPGWYSTYWVKMLSDIEVLDRSDDNYWMATAYTIPDTPHANVTPGQTGVKMIPISRMVPRSFFTNVTEGASLPAGGSAAIRGIAFGGDTGVAKVELSMDTGRTWQLATLADDFGKYSFRRWQVNIPQLMKGVNSLLVRCTNLSGEVQPSMPNWNNSGFMLNAVETAHITAI